jgi:hypothetical protein
MALENFALHASHLHGTDSNSLIRLYQRAHQVSARAATQIERDNAARSARAIARELLGRGVRV